MILFFLFIVVPAMELGLLIEIGEHVGTLPTLMLIVVTGMIGASLARRQGFAVLRRIEREMAGGQMPADAMQDGMMLLLAGALLITPGVLTDVVGFLCLVPAFRALVKRELARRMAQAVRDGRVTVVGGFPPNASMRNVTPEADSDGGSQAAEPQGPPIRLPDRSQLP